MVAPLPNTTANGTILLNQPLSPKTFKNLQRHEIYYIAGADLHLLVGNILFRVHSYFFIRESKDFQEILSVPPKGSRQGSEDSSAIVLDTSCEDFEKFLFVFYNPKFTVFDFLVDDWIIVLDQAHRWGFQNIKDLAIRELQKLDISDVKRISIYEQYDIQKMDLVPLYSSLCTRSETLALEEAEILGMSIAVRIYQGRERLHNLAIKKKGPPSPQELEKFVQSMLGLIPKKSEAEKSATT